MSAPYEVWVFDGRSPELLGTVPAGDKAAARKLWQNSHHAVIAQGGVVLEPKAGCALKQQTALRVAALAAWLAAGNAPPEPLPTPGTAAPRKERAPRKAARAEDLDEDDEDTGTDEEPDDADCDDPDDPPEVDLDADEVQPSTPAPQPSPAKRAPKAPPLRTPVAPKRRPGRPRIDRCAPPSPMPTADPSQEYSGDTSPTPRGDAPAPAAAPAPASSPTATAADPSPAAAPDASPSPTAKPTPLYAIARPVDVRGWVQNLATCEACGQHRAYRYRPELPEALRALCINDRRLALTWLDADPTRTPEQARDAVVTIVRTKLARRAAAREQALASKGGARRGRPRTPAWTNLRRDLTQLLSLAGRLGGIEGLRALDASRRTGPVAAVATHAAREMARLKASHCIELHTRVDGREMLVTAHWVDGKSPVTLLYEARAERDAAQVALRATQTASARALALVDSAGGVERLEAIFAWAEGLMKLGTGGVR